MREGGRGGREGVRECAHNIVCSCARMSYYRLTHNFFACNKQCGYIQKSW